MRNIGNSPKKSSGVQKWAKIFCHFWFCAICGSTKSCLILKIIPPKTISKILSFESISVFISQKLRKLEQNKMCRFFFPLTVVVIIHSPCQEKSAYTQTRKLCFLKFPSKGLIFYWQAQNHVQSNWETFLSHY